MRELLNNKYMVIDKNSWLEEKGGKKFTITLKKEEWFFTVITRELDK